MAKGRVHFKHKLADRAECQWPAILRLLCADVSKRIVLFKGKSGFSKTSLLRAAQEYAESCLDVTVIYVDFKIQQLQVEANFLKELQLGLGEIFPEFKVAKEINGWVLRESLRKINQPILIIFDTYEKITGTQEFVQWIENQLLAEVVNCKNLRFLVAGQNIPDFEGTRWHNYAEKHELDAIDDQSLWKAWIHELNPTINDDHIEGIVTGLQGVPSTVSQALKVFASKRKQQA